MANNKLFEKQQLGENTDCCFVFKVPSEDGKTSTEKIIHAHKLILTSVSAFFETNFKAEWNKGDAIPITTVEYEIFKKLIKIVYLNHVSLESLDEASKIYEAAHFYQMKDVLALIRDDIPRIWFRHKTVVIGKLLNCAMKCQDWTLLQFFQKVFNTNAASILGENDCTIKKPIRNPIKDWYIYSPEVINFLYASFDIYTSELTLFKALESYLKRTMNPVGSLKPAIKAINCQDIADAEITNATGFNDDAKFWLRQNQAVVASKAKRNKRTFIKELPFEAQSKLIELFSDSSCCNHTHTFSKCPNVIQLGGFKRGVSFPNGPIEVQSKDLLIAFFQRLKCVKNLQKKYSYLANFDLKKEFEDSFFVL